jgi:hypothetical protein
VFQTDGGPDSESAAQHELCAAAEDPIFYNFVGFGTDEFRFLRRLNTLAVPQLRPVDNAGFFEAGADPRARFDGLDGDLYSRLLDEFGKEWLAAYSAYADSQP